MFADSGIEMNVDGDSPVNDKHSTPPPSNTSLRSMSVEDLVEKYTPRRLKVSYLSIMLYYKLVNPIHCMLAKLATGILIVNPTPHCGELCLIRYHYRRNNFYHKFIA